MSCMHAKTIVGQDYFMSINVTAENQGNFTETFNVTLNVNTTVIENQKVNNLPNGTSTILIFTWNTTGFAYGNYTINATADTVIGEIGTTDNTYVDGTVLVTIPGDVTGDRTVDGPDLDALANAYGSTSISPNWNPNADINDNGLVDIFDIGIVGAHWGESW